MSMVFWRAYWHTFVVAVVAAYVYPIIRYALIINAVWLMQNSRPQNSNIKWMNVVSLRFIFRFLFFAFSNAKTNSPLPNSELNWTELFNLHVNCFPKISTSNSDLFLLLVSIHAQSHCFCQQFCVRQRDAIVMFCCSNETISRWNFHGTFHLRIRTDKTCVVTLQLHSVQR